jgi:hypothetical protein
LKFENIGPYISLFIMTMRNYDYTFYLNARTWLDMHKIEVDEEDAPVLGEEDIMNITGRGDPVVIRGVRHGPLAKSQTIPKVEPAGAGITFGTRGSKDIFCDRPKEQHVF